jgi:hypothetical protein
MAAAFPVGVGMKTIFPRCNIPARILHTESVVALSIPNIPMAFCRNNESFEEKRCSYFNRYEISCVIQRFDQIAVTHSEVVVRRWITVQH